MKKYIVKNTLFGKFGNSAEAIQEFKKYINKFYGDAYIPYFDYEIEEVECDEVNEVITDFETARILLFGNDTFDNYQVSTRRYSDIFIPLEHLERLVNETNKKHIVALIALNRLFTIAEAWNKADGFVPDFSDIKQKKWFPKFKYDKDAAGFVYFHTEFSGSVASSTLGQRICFKTSERAEQFGRQFADLYNKVFLTNK